MIQTNGEEKVIIVLTGGGTAGHVMPNLALLPRLQEKGWDVRYIGGRGMERELVRTSQIPYATIASGKLRRYFSWRNFVDIFNVALGIGQALAILAWWRPRVVFSKGGFVSVPVAFAAFVLRIPVIAHESDLTPGLATRMVRRFARRMLFTFPESGAYFTGASSRCVGTPIRQELTLGAAKKGLLRCGFSASDERPVLLVTGGSLGAQRINHAVLAILPELLKRYRIIHLTGKGKLGHPDVPGSYRAFEFLGEELPDILAAADVVLSRAGANSIFELLALRKPMLLVPLEVGSRGDQLHNSEAFARQGWAMLLRESELNGETLAKALAELVANRESIAKAQQTSPGAASDRLILEEISHWV
jgi:UDP-N-acetylglucosamine--N-acetylmuramyl-(pentapeptide) pyrophosphoryl-undecaprenol N-acetylglucosamine transferase